MTTILIATDGLNYGCAIDSGETCTDEDFVLEERFVLSKNKKYLDFRKGVEGRILVTGYLLHQYRDRSLKNFIEVLENEFLPAIPDFSNLFSFVTALQTWLNDNSWHAENSACSNIGLRTIYVLGIEEKNDFKIYQSEYLEDGIKLRFKLLENPYHSIHGRIKIFAHSPVCNKVSEEAVSTTCQIVFNLNPDFLGTPLIRENIPIDLLAELEKHFKLWEMIVGDSSVGKLGLEPLLTAYIQGLSTYSKSIKDYCDINKSRMNLNSEGKSLLQNFHTSAYGGAEVRIF